MTLHVIHPVHTFGTMVVYRREWKEPGLKRYFVVSNTERDVMEEFSRLRDAERWAKKHGN